MADVTYKVEFSVTEDIEKKETQEVTDAVSTSPIPKKTREAKQKGLIDKKLRKPIVLAYATYNLVASSIHQTQVNNMTLRGDNLAAKMKQEKKARTDKYVSGAFSLGMGIAMKGTLGILMIGMEAFKLASEAINIAVENKNIIARLQNEKYLNSIEQSRFIRNTTTEKLRW